MFESSLPLLNHAHRPRHPPRAVWFPARPANIRPPPSQQTAPQTPGSADSVEPAVHRRPAIPSLDDLPPNLGGKLLRVVIRPMQPPTGTTAIPSGSGGVGFGGGDDPRPLQSGELAVPD